MTMFTKDFYHQLKKTGKISLCALSAKTQVKHDDKGLPVFENGYAIRMTGNAQEVPMDTITAKNNPHFNMCIKDQEKYQAMVVFCITSARGDIFDYDFKKITRENKLQRIYFSYNGEKEKYKGLKIETEKCISCELCKENVHL